MGLTAFRLQERRLAAAKGLPPPPVQYSQADHVERLRSENTKLRSENAELARRASELEARNAELQKDLDSLTVPTAASGELRDALTQSFGGKAGRKHRG